MTRQQFIDRAVRAAEYAIHIPPGWWGTYRDVTDGRVRVRFSTHGRCWVISLAGRVVSKHGSRTFAIGKARKL